DLFELSRDDATDVDDDDSGSVRAELPFEVDWIDRQILFPHVNEGDTRAGVNRCEGCRHEGHSRYNDGPSPNVKRSEDDLQRARPAVHADRPGCSREPGERLLERLDL